jgi:hypothetical protein
VKALLIYLGMAIAISVIVIREDRLQKKIFNGFNPNAKDNDKDGLIQEGTKWERKVKK